MEIDDEEIEVTTSSSSKGEKKRFEVKKVRNFPEAISPLCFASSFYKFLLTIQLFICFLHEIVERCRIMGLGHRRW